jgi:hypothetical protein
MYEGNHRITTKFNDNSNLQFEVHFHNKRGEERDKWRKKALTTWKSIANEIHGDTQLSEVGNPIEKSWKQAFEEALKHPKLEEFIRTKSHRRVFDDAGYPREVQGKSAPCIDSVNFTKTG